MSSDTMARVTWANLLKDADGLTSTLREAGIIPVDAEVHVGSSYGTYEIGIQTRQGYKRLEYGLSAKTVDEVMNVLGGLASMKNMGML